MKKKLRILLFFNILQFIFHLSFFSLLNAQIPSNGMIACYPFNGNANDMSGNNYHGTVNGATLTMDRFGRANNAYSFNGSSSYISLPFSPFNLQSFSYSIWACATSYPAPNGYGTLISIGSYGGDQNIGLGNSYASGAKGWTFGSYSAPGTVPGWWQGSLPPLNNWFHFVMTRDANNFCCYINGQQVYSLSISGTSPYYGNGPYYAIIGQRSVMTVNQFFSGKIDDIHIYNRALTATEVLLLFNGANTVTINANPGTTICTGNNVTFTAIINGTFNNPSYQWQVNGVNVGNNSSTYVSNSILNGDVIRCVVSSNQYCEVPVFSNSLTMNVENSLPLSVNITSSLGNNICEGENVIFTATGINGGSNSTYQWKINGINVGTNSNTLSVNTLSNGDEVCCIYSSTYTCATNNPAFSDTIQMIVNPINNLIISISASPGNNICKGDHVIFTAAGVNGGSNATYQWKINNIDVGINSNTLSVDTLTDGAQVICVYSSTLACTYNNPANSNIIEMMVGDSLPLHVNVTASANNFICEGTGVTFTAHGINGGNNATYQWMNNGTPIGNNNPVLSVNINMSDIIYCIYSSPLSCVTHNPDTSGVINMVILSNPILDAGNNVQIILPDGIYLNPIYSGGTPPYTFLWTPENSLSNANIANPFATPIANTNYTLKITDSYGCVAQDTITIFVDTENYIYIPNTFSPNGDTQNDILYVRGKGIQSIEFLIYDRWGEKVFSSYSQDVGWDGTFKGKHLNPGIFAYYFKAKTFDNKTIEKKGNITLIK